MRRRFARGFTLAELMIVVAMVGVLAALAMIGYSKYIKTAHTGEAKAMIQSIRNAEHTYKTEQLAYLSCSNDYTDYYPQDVAGPSSKKWSWINPNLGAKSACFRSLNVDSDGAVYFAYAVVAGGPADVPVALNGAQWTDPPVWPADPQGPWYVVQATGDSDEDGKLAVLVSSSFDNKVYVENEDE